MKIRLSQLFFVLSQPKLSVQFKISFSLMFFKEAIVILSFMYCFGQNTPTYLLPKGFGIGRSHPYPHGEAKDLLDMCFHKIEGAMRLRMKLRIVLIIWG